MNRICRSSLSLLLAGALLVPGAAAFAAQSEVGITRSQFARVLWEEAGRPSAEAGEFFSDVAPGDDNYTAILWCAQTGIAVGDGDSLFQPDSLITREQAAVMLHNLAEANGDGITASDDLSGVSDAASIAGWARSDVQWAMAKTILTTENGQADPKGTLTQTEAETMAQRYTLTSQSFHTLGLTGVSNARQLGGYVTTDGRTVKDGVLLRTGALSDATEEDLAKLADLNLTQIVDFRTTAEREEGPDPVMEGVTNTHINILGDDSTSSSSASSAVTGIYGDDPIQAMIDIINTGMVGDDMYTNMMMTENALAGYRQFFDLLLAQEEGEAILWHCTGGKDRAGVAAVLLLSALGVDRDTVLQDFVLTNDFNSTKINYRAQAAQERGVDADTIQAIKNLTGVSYNAMVNLLDAIDAQYGSMDAFLTAENGMALTQDQLTQLRTLYLD